MAVEKEQVITMLEVSEETINVVTYNFKYDTNSDTITTEKYVYDAFSVKRDLATNATSYIEGTELAVVENGDTLEYTVLVDNVQHEFAAGECSNCVWNFYLYKF